MIVETTGQWGIVEMMGHNVIAGYITQETSFGVAMMRVDVPATSIYGTFTKLLGAGSIYAVTFVSEEVAKKVAESKRVNPVQVYCPDLISFAEHNEIVRRMSDKIAQLQTPALVSGENDELEI